jgi:MFS family permease
LFVYLGVVSLVVQSILIKKTFKNFHKVTLIGLIIISLALIFIAVSPSLIFLAIAIAINAVGSGLAGVAMPTILSTTSSTDPEGEIQGAFEGIGSLGRVIGPALTASFVTIYPRQVIFISAILLAITTIPVLIRPTRSIR